jgi:hypothetical protein
VQAHPHLAGRWTAAVPPGGLMSLRFECGRYLGNGVWRGPFTLEVSGVMASVGEYELRMYSGSQGTLSLMDPLSAPGWTVGNVDFDLPTVTYINTTYKR